MAGGRQRRRRRQRRKARQAAATATHVSSLGDDLLLEIFLRLPSLATLVRAVCTCPAWRRAVVSSPEFRRRFSALRPAPLLGLFADNDCIRLPIPIFAAAGSGSSDDVDPDVLAAIRGGDFGLASLLQERDGGDAPAPEPRRWSVACCRDGYLLLAEWNAGVLLAMVNPLSRRGLNSILLRYDGIVAGCRSYLTCLRNEHWLSSDQDEDPMAFRLIWLCHDESRVRAAVFSSDTWAWRVLPWADVGARTPPYDEDVTDWLHPGTEAAGVVCWRVRSQERVLALNTKTMAFSVWELPPPCWQLEGWPRGSFGVVVGETMHGEPCIVRDTAFGIDVLRRRGVDSGAAAAEKWLVDDGILNWHDAALFDNPGRLDLLGVKDGFLYLATAEMVLSLRLETMEIAKLFPTPTGHHFNVARFYPYFRAWPASLVATTAGGL